jgi:hypothetical protein
MGVGMSFSAKLELNEAQETELEAMTLRHEQATSFQFQLQGQNMATQPSWLNSKHSTRLSYL